MYWGVDSFSPLDTRVNSNGEMQHGQYATGSSTDRTLFDLVTAHYGRAPSFWGRYLNATEGSRLRDHEPVYLAARSTPCKLLLVYNDRQHMNRASVALSGDAGRNAGMWAAIHAVTLASVFVPAHRRWSVRLYADLERWWATSDWIIGWWEEMARSSFVGLGGFYGGVFMPRASWLGPQPRPFRVPSSGRLAPPWSTNIGWAMGLESSAWSDRIVDEVLAQRIGDPLDYSCYLWATDYIWSARAGARDHGPIPTQMGGGRTMGADTVLWQYGRDFYRPRRTADSQRDGWLVDLDVASPRGYADMWNLG